MKKLELSGKFHRRISVLIFLVMLIEMLVLRAGTEGSVFAAENDEVVEISSAEDFQSFAEKAGDDTYTAGKCFVLTRDLYFSGRNIRPVQVFAGTFDGRGHMIEGYSFSGRNSGTGLFRTILRGGEVKDLKLSITFYSEGEMRNIGGIAGVNQGVIRNCSVDGYILGLEAVGGIAGRNAESGLITGCVNSASVHGMRRTGGIAGFNEGIIESCSNKGEINTGSKTAWEINDKRENEKEDSKEGEEIIDDDEVMDSAIPDSIIPDNSETTLNNIRDLITNDKSVNYTGGIAGANSGEVRKCRNSGTVGYKHLGYKTGGIVGYQRGILDSSDNSGTIYGRKNTGGIAGQFEPFEKDEFFEDSFSRADKESDILVGLIDQLQNELKGEDDNIQARIDDIRRNADDLRGSISEYKDYYRGKDDVMEADMRSHTDSIRNIVNDLDINMKPAKTEDILENIQIDVDGIHRLMSGAEKAAASGVIVDVGSYIADIRSIVKDIDKQTVAMLEQAQNAGKEYNEFRKSASKLRNESNAMDDFLRNAYDSYKIDLRSTDNDLTNKTDTIADNMDALSDALKSGDRVVRNKMDGITASLKRLSSNINEGMDEVRSEIDRYRNTKHVNDIFDDISDDTDKSPSKGRITGCRNTGSIITDINGGGIAGMVDTDIDLQSDFDVDSEGDYSMKRSRTKRATIIGCRNDGAVIVKNDCAGGIAGSMDTGAVISSINFGPVETEEGNYTGGIVGKSGYMIRDSFSMSQVSGNEYVGGIAGYGVNIIDNKALSTISKGVKERSGAIAGDVDEKEKTVSGNIYVDDSLGAVNGLTFENEARAVSFEEFITLPGVPDEGKTMTVTFMSGGEVLKTMEVPYGSSLSKDDYPDLPDDENGFGIWEGEALTDIRQNTVINSGYVSYSTTVASREPFPVMLLSGKFYKNAYVRYEKNDADPSGKYIAKYSFNIVSDYYSNENKVYVRLLSDDLGKNDSAAMMKTDGSFMKLPTSRDGRYMVFPYSLLDQGGEFYILKGERDHKRIIIYHVIGGVIVLLIILILLNSKKRSGKKQSDPA